MRIIIACRSFHNMAGGVERQSISLANEMVKRGHEIAFITWDQSGAKAFYDMNEKVKWFQVGENDPTIKASLLSKIKRAKKVRKIVKDFNAETILAFQQGMFLSMRLYLFGLGIPVIAAERESPFRYDFIKEGKIKNFIFQTFRLAKKITVQCKSYVREYPDYLKNKIVVIPNPVFPAKNKSNPRGTDKKKKQILCVARLSFAKNQQALIEAFSLLSNKFPDWDLILAGEGEARTDIEELIKQKKLQNRIKLLGAVKDVSILYQESQIFCIPSRWEGFPNVLGEALAHGLPCVGYRNCGGVNDLIDHNKNGILADGNGDIETLSSALETLMEDEKLRIKMGENAIVSIAKFKPSEIYDLWENFLIKVCKPKR